MLSFCWQWSDSFSFPAEIAVFQVSCVKNKNIETIKFVSNIIVNETNYSISSNLNRQLHKLLYQLSHDWAREYSELALAIAVSIFNESVSGSAGVK
jgi:hypothetical protein